MESFSKENAEEKTKDSFYCYFNRSSIRYSGICANCATQLLRSYCTTTTKQRTIYTFREILFSLARLCKFQRGYEEAKIRSRFHSIPYTSKSCLRPNNTIMNTKQISLQLLQSTSPIIESNYKYCHIWNSQLGKCGNNIRTWEPVTRVFQVPTLSNENRIILAIPNKRRKSVPNTWKLKI